MNCDRCHEPINEQDAWKAIVHGHGRVPVCDQCHDEYKALNALSITILRHSIQDWYEGIGPQGDSIPEFEAQRHRVLSLAAGRMFELIEKLIKANTTEELIIAKQRIWRLYGEIKEALKEPTNLRDLSSAPGSKMTKEQALKMLETLPSDAKTVASAAHPSTLAAAVNLNASLLLQLGAILKQTIKGFPERKEDDQPCVHGQE